MLEERRSLAVDGNRSQRVERFPCDASGIRDPIFVGSGVAARLLVLLNHLGVGRLELRLQLAQFLVSVYLETQVIHTIGLTVG